jgi:hypothetical protein
MLVKIGTWVAGRRDVPQGTVEWAGGYANLAAGPYEAIIKSVHIKDYGGGVPWPKEYVYQNRSGTWESIKVVAGDPPPAESPPAGSSSPNPTSNPGPFIGIIVGIGVPIIGAIIFIIVRCYRRREAINRAHSRANSSHSFPPARDELHGNPVSEIDGILLPSWMLLLFKKKQDGQLAVAELPANESTIHELDASPLPIPESTAAKPDTPAVEYKS